LPLRQPCCYFHFRRCRQLIASYAAAIILFSLLFSPFSTLLLPHFDIAIFFLVTPLPLAIITIEADIHATFAIAFSKYYHDTLPLAIDS